MKNIRGINNKINVIVIAAWMSAQFQYRRKHTRPPRFLTSRLFRHNPQKVSFNLYWEAKPTGLINSPLLIYNISGIEFQIWGPTCTILWEANTVLRIRGLILNFTFCLMCYDSLVTDFHWQLSRNTCLIKSWEIILYIWSNIFSHV